MIGLIDDLYFDFGVVISPRTVIRGDDSSFRGRIDVRIDDNGENRLISGVVSNYKKHNGPRKRHIYRRDSLI